MHPLNAPLEIRLAACTLRPFRRSDAGALVLHGGDPAMARNLRDVFPHPYGPEDARFFLESVAPGDASNLVLAVDVEGVAAGCIGLQRLDDVWRRTAEVGFWIGAPFRGRGLATDAVAALSAHALSTWDICRLQARVFAWNTPSARVLEKAGYQREAVHRMAISKAGRTTDEVVFARILPERALDA